MHIEHVAMYVEDLEKARDFFVKYFNATSNGGYHNKTTNFRSYFLSFDDGARLEIMNKPEIFKRMLKLHCPGNVTGNNNSVIITDKAQPIAFYSFGMVFPPFKNIHWLICRQ